MTQEQKDLIKEMYKYYQYTWEVDDVNNFECKIKETFPDIFKPEKYEPKVGEWVYLKHLKGACALIKFNGYREVAFGFTFIGTWTNNFICHLNDSYYPANSQEVESQLRQYALDVLGIGNDTEIQGHVDKTLVSLNAGNLHIIYNEAKDILWNRNGCIYSNGKWAKKKDPMPDDFKKLIEKYGKETLSKYLK